MSDDDDQIGIIAGQQRWRWVETTGGLPLHRLSRTARHRPPLTASVLTSANGSSSGLRRGLAEGLVPRADEQAADMAAVINLARAVAVVWLLLVR
ncbi:MAG: hypothetical protein ACTHJW_12845 [Streptosporangiaceae bacterium]